MDIPVSGSRIWTSLYRPERVEEVEVSLSVLLEQGREVQEKVINDSRFGTRYGHQEFELVSRLSGPSE